MPLSDAFLSGIGALAKNEAVRLGAQQLLQGVYDRMARRQAADTVIDVTPSSPAGISREDLSEAVAAIQVQTEAAFHRTRAEIAADTRLALRPLYAIGAVILLLQAVLIVLLAR